MSTLTDTLDPSWRATPIGSLSTAPAGIEIVVALVPDCAAFTGADFKHKGKWRTRRCNRFELAVSHLLKGQWKYSRD